RIVGACIDITDFKKAQKEALARQRLESLGLLAGGVAHDFGNILGSILMVSEVALANVEQNSAIQNTINSIRNLTLQAGELVRVLMAYAGQETPVFERVDLSKLVVETLDALRGSVGTRVTLKTHLPGNLPPVHGNPAQLRQVIMNLVANACEALNRGE